MSNAKAMSLKAKIRNIAKSKNLPAQVILCYYIYNTLWLLFLKGANIDE